MQWLSSADKVWVHRMPSHGTDSAIAGVQISGDFHLDRKLAPLHCDSTSMTEGSILAALSAIVATRTTHCPVPLHRSLSFIPRGFMLRVLLCIWRKLGYITLFLGSLNYEDNLIKNEVLFFLMLLCGFLPQIIFSWVCLEKVPIRLGDKGGTSECSTWIPWKNYTLFINSRAGRQYRGVLGYEETQHDMECSSWTFFCWKLRFYAEIMVNICSTNITSFLMH